MENFKVQRGLEISLPLAQNNKINFANDPRLNGKKIKAIIARTFDTTGTGLITSAVKRNMFLSLKVAKGSYLVERMPLYLLDPKDNSTGVVFQFDFSEEINFQESYIEWTPVVLAGESLSFFVVYDNN